MGADVDVSEEELDDCKEFIRTVMYRGKADESYLQTRIRLYIDQNITSKWTLTIPPDEDSCTQLFIDPITKPLFWKWVYVGWSPI